jgi:PrtD family type I secretion system ABC transporter
MNAELQTSLRKCLGALGTVGLMSGGSNVLALTGSIFMLAVYDRVIPSGSVPTLIALGLIALVAFGLQTMLDIFRAQMLTRVGLVFRETLDGRIYDITIRNAATGNYRPGSAVRDLDSVQGFMSSMGPTALFDLPWLPLYLGICFAFHTTIGLVVTVGVVLLVGLTLLAGRAAKRPTSALSEAMALRTGLLNSSQNQAETIHAMGMTGNLARGWNRVGDGISHWNTRLADTTNILSTISRMARMVLQSVVLAVGAWLVILGDATGGVMIASSILSARALAPIELAIGHWKGFVSARQSWDRLSRLLDENPAETSGFVPPRPQREIRCENVTLGLTVQRRILVRDVSFTLNAGEALAIVGPTGSGKSTLAKALVGLWEPAAGSVRLDGLSISDWPSAVRGAFIGYLPQNIGLFEGTIAENIARFDSNANDDEIVRVAKVAGVHDLVSRLPEGYNTVIDESGGGLSGGQVQRIGLARALYGDPALVVLDEPNSNLDSDGDVALAEAIKSLRARNAMIVITTHRTGILAAVDRMLLLANGRVQDSGTRNEVLANLRRERTPVAGPQAAGTNPGTQASGNQAA